MFSGARVPAPSVRAPRQSQNQWVEAQEGRGGGQNHGADRNRGSCGFNLGPSLELSPELNPSAQTTPRPTFTRKWEPGTRGSRYSPRWRTSDLAKRLRVPLRGLA